MGQHFCPPTNLQGLLEPGAVKAARPVLSSALLGAFILSGGRER
jgi:hypothetical protein